MLEPLQEIDIRKTQSTRFRFQTCAGIPKDVYNFKGNQYSLDYKVGGKTQNDQIDVSLQSS
jgi:hypothetical protein